MRSCFCPTSRPSLSLDIPHPVQLKLAQALFRTYDECYQNIGGVQVVGVFDATPARFAVGGNLAGGGFAPPCTPPRLPPHCERSPQFTLWAYRPIFQAAPDD